MTTRLRTTSLGVWPTPMQHCDDLGLHVKREDLCGFAFGGSKVRALEPLLDLARGSAADSIVVGGRRDSNWLALAALAATRFGLGCHCVIDPGATEPLALSVVRRTGATVHVAPRAGATAVNRLIDEVAARIAPGAYPIPRAGATAGGVVGYLPLAREILAELPARPLDVVVALGSGTAVAGLLLALEEDADGADVLVHGVPVAKSLPDARAAVRGLLVSAALEGHAGADPDRALRRLRLVPRSGTHSPLAAAVAARCGVLLDPVFAGPAWHAFCGQRAGTDRQAVLIASGGLPAYLDAARGDR